MRPPQPPRPLQWILMFHPYFGHLVYIFGMSFAVLGASDQCPKALLADGDTDESMLVGFIGILNTEDGDPNELTSRIPSN